MIFGPLWDWIGSWSIRGKLRICRYVYLTQNAPQHNLLSDLSLGFKDRQATDEMCARPRLQLSYDMTKCSFSAVHITRLETEMPNSFAMHSEQVCHLCYLDRRERKQKPPQPILQVLGNPERSRLFPDKQSAVQAAHWAVICSRGQGHTIGSAVLWR